MAKKPAAKAAPKKAAPKKAAAKAAAPKKAAGPKPAPVTERWSKTQILTEIAARTDITRKQAGAVLEELGSIIGRHIGKSGPKMFVLPGMLKITTKVKPAIKKGTMVKKPGSSEMIKSAGRKESVTVRVRALKKLKDLAN